MATTKPEAIVNQAAAAPATVVVAPSKADKARAIFNECYKDPKNIPARKDIITRFVQEAGLTKAGAGTYLQNFKDKAGLTVKRAKPGTPTA